MRDVSLPPLRDSFNISTKLWHTHTHASGMGFLKENVYNFEKGHFKSFGGKKLREKIKSKEHCGILTINKVLTKSVK